MSERRPVRRRRRCLIGCGRLVSELPGADLLTELGAARHTRMLVGGRIWGPPRTDVHRWAGGRCGAGRLRLMHTRIPGADLAPEVCSTVSAAPDLVDLAYGRRWRADV